MSEPRFCWAPYGNVAAEVQGPDGQVCIVGLPAEKRMASIRERMYRADDAHHREHEEARLLEGRDANVAWAERIAGALNAYDGGPS